MRSPKGGDEDLLRDLLAGDRRADDPDVSGRLAADADLAAEHEGQREVAEALAHAARIEREDRAAADRLGAGPGDERVAGEVARWLAERRAEEAAPAPRRAPLAAVAATLLIAGAAALWFATRWGGAAQDGEPPSVRLLGGDDGGGALAPVGEVERFGSFRWSAALPENGWFVLLVHGGGEGWTPPLFESEPLTARQLDVPPEVTRDWPERIRWEVLVRDASGQVVGSVSTSASRSSR